MPKYAWYFINKLQQVLQSAMDLLQIATGLTKCDDHYKLRQYDSRPLPATHDPRNLTTLNTCPLTRVSIKSFRRAQKWDHFAMVETNIELI